MAVFPSHSILHDAFDANESTNILSASSVLAAVHLTKLIKSDLESALIIEFVR